MKNTLAALAMFAGAFVAVPAHAQFKKTEDAIKYRQAAFTLMGNHMGRLSAMAKGEVPFDAAKAQESAQLIATASKLPWEGFVPNSVSNEMKADPAKDATHFKELNDKATVEVTKLVSASATLDGLKAQLGKTGGTCKACHQDYRK